LRFSAWRSALCQALIALARRIAADDIAPAVAVKGACNGKPLGMAAEDIGTPRPTRPARPEVTLWMQQASPSVMLALGGTLPYKLEQLLNRTRMLPDEDTVLDFLARVPRWWQLPVPSSARLLERLADASTRGRVMDEPEFSMVKDMLFERSRLLFVPPVWDALVAQAAAERRPPAAARHAEPLRRRRDWSAEAAY
jgi:hypothetical protein